MKNNANPVEIFQKFFDSRMEDIHTAIPGEIVSYTGHTKRTAKVKPLVKLKTLTGEDIALPVLDNVPVIFPGSKSFQLKFPVKKGDGCLIVFAETGIGNWLAGAGQDARADDRTRFSLTDAIAIPGLWTTKNSPKIGPTIEITSDGKFIIKNDTEALKKLLDDLITVLSSLTTQGGPTTQTVSPATISALAAIKARMALLMSDL